MSETTRNNSDLLVRRMDIDRVETFDAQFWPVVVGLCTLSAFSAGAMVTLLDGTAMWVSLLAIPVAFFVLLLTLRLVDNRRFRRSMQLGLMLSLAIHLMFVVFASRIDLFGGIVTAQPANSQATTKPRVIEISSQREEQPWMELNEVPTVQPEEKIPEREEATTENPVDPKPVLLEPTPPKPEPQLVKRETRSETVPMQGESLSKAARSETNVQPEATVKTETSRAAASSSSAATSASPSQTAVDVARSSPAETSQMSKSSERTPEIARGMQPAENTQRSRRQPTADSPSAESLPERSKNQIAEATPTTTRPVVDRSTATSESSQPAREMTRASATDAARSAPAPSQVTRRNDTTPEPSRSASEQTALLQRRQTENTTSVQLSTELRESPRRSMTTSAEPTTSNNLEMPRVTNQTPANSPSASMSERAMAMDRSTVGTSGIGTSKNMGREVGSRQSPATTPSQSARRESQQNSNLPSQSLTAMQASRSPGRIANTEAPSSSVVADGNPAAVIAANPNTQPFTENASASLESATTTTHRSELSAEKGESNVDVGATRIVTENRIDRVEGGGQPEMNMLRESQDSRRSELAGSQAPSINAEIESGTTAAPFQPPSARSSENPQPNAKADVASRDGGSKSSSGEFSGQRREAPERGVGQATSSDSLSKRTGESEDSVNMDLERSLGTTGRSEDRDDEAAMPQTSMLADERASIPASESRGDGESLNRPAMEASRETSSGSVTLGMSEAAGQETRATVGETSPQIERRGGNENGPTVNDALAESSSGRGDRSDNGSELSIDNNTLDSNGDISKLVEGQGADSNSLIQRDSTAKRETSDGMPLDIEAPIGAAGLADRVEIETGLNDRRASTESPTLAPSVESRFRREDIGGTPAINPNAVVSREPFSSRRRVNRSSKPPTTEETIELGLAFLARNQETDGSWSLGKYDLEHPDHALQMNSDSAATGLALLAFQGAGYNHLEFKYANQMSAAIDWLIQNQKPNGDLYVETDETSNAHCRFYSHGIATLALAEAYGMTQDQDIKTAAQKAINFIERTQHSRLGGWRYVAGTNTDTSVTGFIVMALQSGRLSGLKVNDKTLEHVNTWLGGARDVDVEYKFRYRPGGNTDNQNYRSQENVSTPSMTSVGLLMRLYLGWDREDQRLIDGADYLLEYLPSDASERQRDTYYWYYATQVLRHVGGDRWKKWNEYLHPLLVRTQVKQGEMSGSWHPYQPIPDYWGRKGGGRLYVTTMNLLSLEVDYRLLPLYDETVK